MWERLPTVEMLPFYLNISMCVCVCVRLNLTEPLGGQCDGTWDTIMILIKESWFSGLINVAEEEKQVSALFVHLSLPAQQLSVLSPLFSVCRLCSGRGSHSTICTSQSVHTLPGNTLSAT